MTHMRQRFTNLSRFLGFPNFRSDATVSVSEKIRLEEATVPVVAVRGQTSRLKKNLCCDTFLSRTELSGLCVEL